MSWRKILVIVLILLALTIPIIQAMIGFYYIDSVASCPLQNDIMLLMSIGGVFQAIFMVALFGFLQTITPVRFRLNQKAVQEGTAKKTNTGLQLLIGE
jgi:H+/Cl- antiporter ClcA